MHSLARTSPRPTERRRDGARQQSPGAIFVLSALVALAALAPDPLLGQGWIDPGPRPWPGDGVVKLRTAVDVRVADGVAHVEVEEWFENRGGAVAEGDYLYPLPGEAVFSG
ncbi:MAG: hypothetical protein ACOC8B_08565, partial [Gemmatimonadota bacterium]